MENFKRNKYRFSNMSVVTEKGKEIVELREKEISLLIKELFLYKVLLRDLVNHFPTSKDRNLILNIAYYIIEERELFERFERNRQLPLGKLSNLVKVSRGFLEIWQDYIIAYVLIISNPNYTYIQNYIKVELSEDAAPDNVVSLNSKKDVSRRGIAVKVEKKTVIILTSSGEFYRLKKSDNVYVGEETHGFEKIGFAHYKFHVIIGVLFISLLCGAAYKSYTKVNSTVIFTCSSQIKLQINKNNRVIYAYSPTDKGTDMINKVSPLDKDIDKCLKELLEYAQGNSMSPADGYLVVITGHALEYGGLKETDRYIVDNGISIQINNGGSLHNVYESVQIQNKKEE